MDPLHRRVRLVAGDDLARRLGQPRAVRADRAVRRRADGPVRHPPGGRGRAVLVAAGSGLTVFMTASLAAAAAVGRARRARHRLDGAGVRGDGREPLVRPAPRPGHSACSPPAARRASWCSCRCSRGSPASTAGARRRSPSRSPRWPSCRWCSGCCGTAPPTSGSGRTARPRRSPTGRARHGRRRRADRAHALRGAARHRRVLAAGRRVRHLRRVDQRPDRHALHPRGARPRDARDDRGGAARAGRASSTSSARSCPAG